MKQTRTWVASDCSANSKTHTQLIIVEPTGPIMAGPYQEEITILCGEEIPVAPEITFTEGCGNYNVVFNEESQTANDTDDYLIIRTWNVTDSCNNKAVFEQVIFVLQPQLQEITLNICIEDGPINLINLLPDGYNSDGNFEITFGNATIEDGILNPINLELGEYRIEYSSTEEVCKYYVVFTIFVNDDCVPCGKEQIMPSTVVTANGDGVNDYFEIKGAEYCGYTYDVTIFNRWGNIVLTKKIIEMIGVVMLQEMPLENLVIYLRAPIFIL